VTESGDECQLERLTSLVSIVERRGALRVADSPFLVRLDPRHVRARVPGRAVNGIRDRLVIERQDASAAAGNRVEAHVRRDPMQPVPQLAAAAEGRERPPGAQERVLECVLRIVRRPEHPVAAGVERGAVRLDEAAEGTLVAAASAVEQPPVRSSEAVWLGRLRRLILGADDDAGAGFLDCD
jgi:hypothetical protein